MKVEMWEDDFGRLLTTFESRESYNNPYIYSIREVNGDISSFDLTQVISLITVLDESYETSIEHSNKYDNGGGDY